MECCRGTVCGLRRDLVWKWGGVVVSIGLIITAILIAVSYQRVDYHEYGLLYSTASRVILDQTAYGPGKHLVGIGNAFHKFPSTQQTVEFSATAQRNGGRGPVSVRTEDKFINVIELSLQYTLIEDQIYNLFDQYKFDYEQYFVRDAIGAFNNVGPKFTAEEFFTKRQKFENTLFNALDAVLRTRYAKLEGLQLLRVNFDQKIEDQLLSDQVRNETNVLITVTNDLLVNTSYWERETERVEANITAALAEYAEVTKQMLVAIDLEIATIKKNTETGVKRIEAETTRQLLQYNQKTENQRLQIFSNVTLIRKETESILANISAQIDLERAAHNARQQHIRSESDANATLVLAKAAAQVQEAEEALYPEHMGQLAEDLGLSAEELVKYEWVAALDQLKSAKVYLDYRKPWGMPNPVAPGP